MERCPFCTFEAEALGERCPTCGNEVRAAVPVAVAAAGEEAETARSVVGDQVQTGIRGGFRRFRRWSAVAVVALLAVSTVYGFLTEAGRDADTGEVTKAGQVATEDFRIGDCLEMPDADEFHALRAVPCQEPHDLEIFHQFTFAPGPYPSDAEFEERIIAECDPVFATYVGIAYEDSALDYDWFFPLEGAWEDGERTVECVLFDMEGEQLAGSMRDSGR